MKGLLRSSRFPAVLVLAAVSVFPARAEDPAVTGSIAAGIAGLSTSGSQNAFKSQFFMGKGFFLEDLSLSARGADGREKLNISAWGFGGAEPAAAARVHWLPNDCWKVELDYDKRWSFLGLAEADAGSRSDLWRIERWRGRVT